MRFLIGLVIGLLIVPIGIWLYLTAGSPPVAKFICRPAAGSEGTP